MVEGLVALGVPEPFAAFTGAEALMPGPLRFVVPEDAGSFVFAPMEVVAVVGSLERIVATGIVVSAGAVAAASALGLA